MESVQNSYRHSGGGKLSYFKTLDETFKRLPLRESRDFNNRRMTKNNSMDPRSDQVCKFTNNSYDLE